MAKALAFPGLCRLQVDSTTQISLQRFQGAWVPIKASGSWQASFIPSSGPTLANTGLTAATLYYIYAFDNAGTLTLEASATAPATDTDTGIRIKTGDASRTLVGMVFMDSGTPGTFVDSTAKRWCLNYFNRRVLDVTGTYSTNRSTASGTYVEMNSEIRCQFLTWADEAIVAGASGTATNGSAGHATVTGIAIDNTTALASCAYTNPASQANTRGPFGITAMKTLSEGSHYATLIGMVSGGTANWESADDNSVGAAKVRLFVQVNG